MKEVVAVRTVNVGGMASQYDGCKGLPETEINSTKGNEPGVDWIY